MNIVIPSRDRSERVFTLRYIPPELAPHTYVVVPPKQVRKYQRRNPNAQIIACPVEDHAGGFKQWVFDEFDDDDQLAIADDDLKFFHRTDLFNAPTLLNLNEMPPEESLRQKQRMWQAIARSLRRPYLPWVGISYRMGSNNVFVPHRYVERSFSMWAVRRSTLIEHNIRFAEMQVMEDMYAILSLLTLGYRNIVYYKWSWNGLSNSKGGCSVWRTSEIQRAGAERLAATFPEYVSLYERVPKSECWFGQGVPAYQVRVKWKKAYQDAI
jgi:hypothetical protein